MGIRLVVAADDLGDLHMYDPAEKSWTDLSSPLHGQPAPRRDSHGFTWLGQELFVHGGEIGTSEMPSVAPFACLQAAECVSSAG